MSVKETIQKLKTGINKWKLSIYRDIFFLDIASNTSLVTLQFRSKNLESEWRRKAYRKERLHIRASILMAIVLVAAFTPLDFIYIPEKSHYVTLARWGIMVPLGVALFFGTFHAKFRERPSIYIIIVVGVVGLCWPALLIMTADSETQGLASINYFFPAVIMTVLFAFFLLGLPFTSAALVAWSIAIAFSLGVMVANVPTNPTINANAAVIVCTCIATVAAYKTELIARALFLRTRRMRRQGRELARTGKKKIDWLENIVPKVLRHELKTEIHAAGSSLELIEAKNTSCDVATHIKDAENSLGHIDNILSMLVKATSIEAAVYSSPKEGLSLTYISESTAKKYQIMYGTHRLSYRIDPEIYINGNEHRIVQMMNNLVSNAFDHAKPDTTVEVTVVDYDQDSAVIVKNIGERLPQGIDIFEMNMSARARKEGMEEHHGLGLYLVKLIAEFHGGSVNAYNCEKDEAVEFEVRIPLLDEAIDGEDETLLL